MQVIEELTVRMARENPRWGYSRIRGALRNLGHRVGRTTITGITPGPNEAWMMQIGRNLTDPFDEFLAAKKYLILDRDSKYSVAFQDLLEDSGVKLVRLPHRSPNLNAYAERFVRSIKDSVSIG